MEAWTTIRYLHAQGMGQRAIARQLGIARKTVQRALQAGGPPKYERPPRPNPKLARFLTQIEAWYGDQHLIGSRMLRELRAAGYEGGPTAVYTYLRQLKATRVSGKVTERFETAPGHQGQFDWSPYAIDLGGELRRVIVFGLVLGYSRRKHYTASLDERQVSIFEAIEESLWHFGGAPKELLVDNAKAFVLDARPGHFTWNPQFLELCGHYRMQPRACQVRRPQTKGKVERPFAYLEEQFIKGNTFRSLAHFLDELARFERADLDMRVHQTTQAPPLERFAAEQAHLTSLPAGRFLGTLAQARKVSWDCLVSFGGSRYSVPAAYAGQLVWVLPARGTHLRVVNAHRETIAEHALSPARGATVIVPAHYAALRRDTPRTSVVLAEAFRMRFPDHPDFLAGLTAQHPNNPEAHLRGVLELASLYDEANVQRALTLARAYHTYSHSFLRGVLESGARPQADALALPAPATTGGRPGHGAPQLPVTAVHCDLGVYQRLLEVAR